MPAQGHSRVGEHVAVIVREGQAMITDQMVEKALYAWTEGPYSASESMRAALTAALGDAVVVPATAVNYDDILSRISVWRDYEPEEDETWESWYYAAFDLLRSEVVEMQKASTVTRHGRGTTTGGA